MEIKVGKYWLKSDKFCCWIEEEYKDKNGKTTSRRVAGYVTKMDRLLEDFIDKKFKDSDAKSMEEVIKILDEAVKDAKKIAVAAYKGDFKIIRHKEK